MDRVTARLLYILPFVLISSAAAACEICVDRTFEGGRTHIWCEFPEPDSWGYDECYMKQAEDGGETCWTGQSMCMYTEVGPPGGGGGGGSCWSGGGGWCSPECFSCAY